MSTTVNGSIALTVRIQEALSSGIASGPIAHVFDTFAAFALDNGTSSGKIDKVWSSKDRALAGAATESLDFAGSLTDQSGASLTMAKLKLLLLYNSGTVSIRWARPANGIPIQSGTTDGTDIDPGGFALWFSPTGVTVTPGSGDLTKITNNSGGTGATYTVLAVGTSA